tara:strand:+ start:299 stop:1561 length:1263 start_codon:yes stop_codon:yes gene_type:complete
MTREKLLKNFNFDKCLSCLFVFILPLKQEWSTIFLVFWVFYSILTIKRKSLSKQYYYFIPIIIFLIYYFSFLWDNASFEFKQIESKLSLVAFPLIFFIKEEKILDFYPKVFKYFIFGCCIASLICFFYAFSNSLILIDQKIVFKPNILEGYSFFESITQGDNYFFSTPFSIFHQTVYFATQICIAITMLTYFPFKKKTINVAVGSLLILSLVLISNRANFIIFIIITPVICYKLIKSKKQLILVFLLFISSFFILSKVNPRFQSLFSEVKQGVTINADARYGSSLRILSWDASLEIIKDNFWLGVGFKNAQQELNDVYLKKEYYWPLKWNLNAHNQYLQIWIETGLVGFAFLLLSFLVLVIKIHKAQDTNHKFFLITILIIVIINFLFESFLNRYSGITLYTFIFCICCMLTIKKNRIEG